jgi:uncharacterized protein
MIIFLSPSKTLNTDLPDQKLEHTQSEFLKHSKKLAAELKTLSSKKIEEMMSVSSKIAELNYDRYQKWKPPFTLKNAKQSILTFKGDVYRDIETDSYTKENFEFIQDNVLIISGLYGLLRPLDLMQPYRLEMKFRYKYWKPILTKYLQESLQKSAQTIINLASKEYSSAIDLKALDTKIVTPVFKEKKGQVYKTIPIYSKIARGTMTNWIVKNRINNSKDIKNFKEDHYKFSPSLSSQEEFVFTRNK